MSEPNVTESIKASKPVINVSVPVTTYINGRRVGPPSTVAVADYLTRQFMEGKAPFYRDPANLVRAIAAIRSDLRRARRHRDPETAKRLQKDIDQLESLELP